MQTAFLATFSFLISTLFSLYIFAVMLRFLLQWVKADFYNPICQFLIKITNPLLIPLRRVIPGLFGIDLAAIILMLILEAIELGLLLWLAQESISQNIFVFALAVVFRLLTTLINLYFFAIIARAIASWFAHNPYQPHPILEILYKLTEPLLAPARRLIKPIAGVDLSPVVVLILLQILNIFLSHLF